MKFNGLVFVLILVTFFSCADGVRDEDLEKQLTCETEITYTHCIKAIIDSKCVSCHYSGTTPIAPFPLETYEQVKTKSKAIVTVIQLPDDDINVMPKSGRMDQDKIDLIIDWLDSGLLE